MVLCEGVVLGAYAGFKEGIGDAFVAEAKAVVCALEFANQMGLLNVEIEGDALGIIKRLNCHDTDLSPIGNLIEEAKCKLSLLHPCSFLHTIRGNNRVAHCLAKFGRWRCKRF